MDRDDFNDPRFDERDRHAEHERLLEEMSLHQPFCGPWDRPGMGPPLWPDEVPSSLDERLSIDIGIFRGIEGLKAETWARATFEQRLEALRETERQLAASQGRVAFRCYSLELPRFHEGHMQRREYDRDDQGIIMEDVRFAEGGVIRVSEALVRSDEPEHAVLVFAHESFHAYQNCVIWARSRSDIAPSMRQSFPEVDALTLAQWKLAGPHSPEHPLEVHAERYAITVAERLYPGYWGPDWPERDVWNQPS